MESFVFAMNAVLPLIIIVCIGYALRRVGFLSENTPKELNKIIFRVFLPCMLFVNIYDMDGLDGVSFGYIVYAIAAVFVIFFSAIPIVMAVTKKGERRGVLLQSVFRSNFALIGLSLVSSLCGDSAIGTAALLSAFAIPVFNVLAVIALSVFMDNEGGISIKKILLDIIKNPLIISVILGVIVLAIRALFVKWSIDWRLSDFEVVFKAMRNLSSISTPIALIALGAQFKISAIKGMRREIIFAILARLVVVPALTIFVGFLFFNFEPAHFASFIALYATPVAVSSVPMTQEMGSDTELAGQIVVWTTAVSGITIFLFTFILKLLGVF